MAQDSLEGGYWPPRGRLITPIISPNLRHRGHRGAEGVRTPLIHLRGGADPPATPLSTVGVGSPLTTATFLLVLLLLFRGIIRVDCYFCYLVRRSCRRLGDKSEFRQVRWWVLLLCVLIGNFALAVLATLIVRWLIG